MKQEIKNAIESMDNVWVGIHMVDGEEAIVVGDWSDLKKVQEILGKFDADDVQNIPIHFDEEIWYCSGCNEYHLSEDTPTAMVRYDWCEQFCAEAIEKLEDVHDAYIEYLTNNEKVCNLLGDSFMKSHGFQRVETHSVGLYGYEDNIEPDEVLEKYSKIGIDVVFSMDEQNPFAKKYSVWIKG